MKVLILLALLAATPAKAQTVQPVEELSWLAGSWISEKDGVVTREAWLAPRDGVMGGVGQTNRAGRKPFIEAVKITTEAAGPTFTATVSGQAPVPFARLPGPPGEAVFENKAHDFPQRVIYRRCDEDLCAAIEGVVKGELKRTEWRYQREQ